MKELTLKQAAEDCRGTLTPEQAEGMITGVQIDSRRVKPGDLFVAIKGEKSDGHDFIGMAASLGASAALVQRPVKAAIPTILVPDTIKAYGDLAAARRERMGMTVIGITGSVGKTTTIGKLASRLTAEGRSVLLCAGDTFRAAAAEQLTVWADRAGCDIVRHEEGSDPAAVVFDAIAAAKARGRDVIIVDTAGRLHNKANLMNELSKIRRVIDRELPDASVECLMVLDATTGQNGLIQAKVFGESAGLTGIVLTKLDGTAKGGIVFAIKRELGLPVKFIGVGEGVNDLKPFVPEEFAEALLE